MYRISYFSKNSWKYFNVDRIETAIDLYVALLEWIETDEVHIEVVEGKNAN